MGMFERYEQRKAEAAQTGALAAQQSVLRAVVRERENDCTIEFNAGDHDALAPLGELVVALHSAGLPEEAEALRDRIASKLGAKPQTAALVAELDQHIDKFVSADERATGKG